MRDFLKPDILPPNLGDVLALEPQMSPRVLPSAGFLYRFQVRQDVLTLDVVLRVCPVDKAPQSYFRWFPFGRVYVEVPCVAVVVLLGWEFILEIVYVNPFVCSHVISFEKCYSFEYGSLTVIRPLVTEHPAVVLHADVINPFVLSAWAVPFLDISGSVQ